MPLKMVFKRVLEAQQSEALTPPGPYRGQWSTWCFSHSMALSQRAQCCDPKTASLPKYSYLFHAHLCDFEAGMGQSIPFLNSTLKISAVGRYSETDKGNVVFLGLPVPALWSLVVFDLAFVWSDSFPAAPGKCALYQHFKGSIAQC